MSEYVIVKPSQIDFLETIPFYYQSKDGEYLLYKKTGELLDKERAAQTRHPDLFIQKQDKERALKELTKGLNMEFAKQVAEGGLIQIKTALCNIVEEALAPGQEAAMLALPETIDILFKNSDQDHSTMEYLSKIATTSPMMVEHTVNVTALTLQYCFFHHLPEKETTKMALCALLHDVGTTKIGSQLIESRHRLTDKEFETYKTHSELGHDMIIVNTDFNIVVATVALEHHERMDKSGYPNQADVLCRESQIIGLIDCYESLTYRDKDFRKVKTPFATLNLIKEEVMEGKFSKKIFKEFTSCLTH